MSALIGSPPRPPSIAVGIAERAHVGGAAVGERLDRRGRDSRDLPRGVSPIGGSIAVTSAGVQLRQVNHFEARVRVAQQAMRARHVAAGQHEAVAALASACSSSRSTWRRPGKLSKVRSSRTSSSRNVAGASLDVRARQAAQRAIERLARRRRRSLARHASIGNGDAARPRGGIARACSPRARRRCTGTGRGRCGRPARAATVVRPVPQPPITTGMRDGRRVERGEHTAFEAGVGSHHRLVLQHRDSHSVLAARC